MWDIRENESEEFDEEEKCVKHEAKLAAKRVSDDEEQELESSKSEETEEDEEEEELPFENILADQRRQYSLKQEYVYLIYNDLVQHFVKKWDSTYLRKQLVPDDSFDESSKNGDETTEKITESSICEETSKNPDWKLVVPDEQAEITFVNGNSYSGRISRQKMEGQGVYRWRNGSRYKGDFEDNEIQGEGRIEWPEGGWYEGSFRDGYRHGKGTLVDKIYNILYIGKWDQGHKHGKGYCHLRNGDSYDGDWIMDKREGEGHYIYPNGARYVGHWSDGFRHGTGTMTWPNSDVYRGEWKNGEMDGYGEYTWNGFFNNTLSWPRENCYMGNWWKGKRHGRGQITLNSIGGARYSGEWKNDQKHGAGMIIGNNGEVTNGGPLFENNILLPARSMEIVPEDEENTENRCGESSKEIHKRQSTEKSGKVIQSRVTTVSMPEQSISLGYYLDRLRIPETLKISSSVVSLMPKECGNCENKLCRCLKRNYSSLMLDEKNALSKTSLKLNFEKLQPKIEESKISDTSTNSEKEKYWTYDCITMHMPRIRKVYDDYSSLFADGANNCRFSMSALSLWQLWRDCRIHRKYMSPRQIDNYLAANKDTLRQNLSCPFERIEIWQLIHALLEVSWHFYTKTGELDPSGYPGKLANGLNKFLINDVYPNVGRHAGVLCGPERDLVSLYPAYKLYQSIGRSPSARQLLASIFSMQDKGPIDSQESLEPENPEREVSKFQPECRNAVVVGERLGYFPKFQESLNLPNSRAVSSEESVRSKNSLVLLRELGIEEFVEVMSHVCPLIKDPESGAIVKMQYELTFLEFLEILIEAAKRLILKRKKIEETADVSEIESVSGKDEGTKLRFPIASETGKSRKKTRNN